MSNPLRVGIGGPVGSGKTALMDWLCKKMRGRYEIAAITNDIYTREDAEFLTRSGALPPERIRGVETGGCPHTAIREDASINLAAVAEMQRTETIQRDDWQVRIETSMRLSCTRDAFLLRASLRAWEGAREVCHREWDQSIPRDLV